MAVLYLTEQGATLRKEGELLVVTKDDQVLEKVLAPRLEQVVVFGNVGLTTPVIDFLLREGIDCVFCTSYGKYHGRLVSTESKFGLLCQRQLQVASDATARLAIAKEIVKGKMLNQRTLLLRYHRNSPSAALAQAIERLQGCCRQVDEVAELLALHGLEGHGAAAYFDALKGVLRQQLGFRDRVRRPPTDPVNSMLSFGYTLLVYGMQAAVRTVGLDPFVGFLHATEYSRPSLVLDLIEEFRPVIVDSVVLRLVNMHILGPEDFTRPEGDGGPVLLTDEARKKFIGYYEERVQTKVIHPAEGVQVTYRRCFELQARQLARVILGREEAYRPFLVK